MGALHRPRRYEHRPGAPWDFIPSTVTYGGGVTRAALLHDFLSRDPLTAQRDADNLFERSLIEAGVSPLRARLLWAGVRVGNGPDRTDLPRLAALLPLALLLLLPWLLVAPWQRLFRLLERASSARPV